MLDAGEGEGDEGVDDEALRIMVERLRSGTALGVVMRQAEGHRSHRTGWLGAAEFGANDGIVLTASLIVGVAAGATARSGILIAALAVLVAGAVSMAAGEYVSVSLQANTEAADLAREKGELAMRPEVERAEFTAIYVKRGLDEPLAELVSTQLTAKDAMAAYARDELGISEELAARPVPAAFASAGVGALFGARLSIADLLAALIIVDHLGLFAA